MQNLIHQNLIHQNLIHQSLIHQSLIRSKPNTILLVLAYLKGLDFSTICFADRSSSLFVQDIEILRIDHRKPAKQTFEQTESFLGKLIKPAHGRDDTDHFTILLANDAYINISVSKAMSLQLASKLESLWRFEALIKFIGQATYEMESGYQIKLKGFIAQDFEIIKNSTTPKDWMLDFANLGDSGWQAYDDPIAVWQVQS